MKAIEYADLYRESLSNPDKAIENVFTGLMSEMQAMIKQRNVKSNDAMHGVIREIIQKWKAFVRIINADGPVLNPDGFKPVLEEYIGYEITETGFKRLSK